MIVIRPSWLKAVKVGAAAILLAGAAYLFWERDKICAAVAPPAVERTLHMVTGEFKSTDKNGGEIEAYRWDPGTVYVKRGDHVRLTIRGINGASHPFVIEGLNIKGEVKKGQETVVTFHADQSGIYRLICLAHPDAAHNGPMIGYVVVAD
ncbi:cupredoxin domain-containing protein [Paenibacillus puerhi]|uniref:cupredoxin domain-containing protein n=1 Tax=Paenibacillus puerhi TaxID=2692622 RepID=UPI001F1BDFA0